MENERRELFTYKLLTGKRIYFFDVKEGRDGARYLVISEKHPNSQDPGRSRIMVFEEHLEEFSEGLHQALSFLESQATSRQVSPPSRKRDDGNR